MLSGFCHNSFWFVFETLLHYQGETALDSMAKLSGKATETFRVIEAGRIDISELHVFNFDFDFRFRKPCFGIRNPQARDKDKAPPKQFCCIFVYFRRMFHTIFKHV